MKKRDRPCPFCGSTDLLPFEKGKKGRRDDSLQTVILAAIFVFTAALSLLLITLVISFPLMVIAAVALISRARRRKKKTRRGPHLLVCLDCGRTVRG
jgi:hypothetical protein